MFSCKKHPFLDGVHVCVPSATQYSSSSSLSNCSSDTACQQMCMCSDLNMESTTLEKQLTVRAESDSILLGMGVHGQNCTPLQKFLKSTVVFQVHSRIQSLESTWTCMGGRMLEEVHTAPWICRKKIWTTSTRSYYVNWTDVSTVEERDTGQLIVMPPAKFSCVTDVDAKGTLLQNATQDLVFGIVEESKRGQERSHATDAGERGILPHNAMQRPKSVKGNDILFNQYQHPPPSQSLHGKQP